MLQQLLMNFVTKCTHLAQNSNDSRLILYFMNSFTHNGHVFIYLNRVSSFWNMPGLFFECNHVIKWFIMLLIYNNDILYGYIRWYIFNVNTSRRCLKYPESFWWFLSWNIRAMYRVRALRYINSTHGVLYIPRYMQHTQRVVDKTWSAFYTTHTARYIHRK